MSQLDIGGAVIKFVAFLFSICFHECAHAWMAYRKGDNTAQLMGRLSLNPVVHADLIGTIVLPIMGLFGAMVFGWAKPVPVNPRNLKNTRMDMFWIAAAGPGSNFLLALFGSFCLVLGAHFFVPAKVFYEFFKFFILINLILCFFNLIPLHPLDGGKILARFLPENLNRKLEEMQGYSMIILLALFVVGALKYVSIPVFYTYNLMINMAESFIP